MSEIKWIMNERPPPKFVVSHISRRYLVDASTDEFAKRYSYDKARALRFDTIGEARAACGWEDTPVYEF